MFKDMDYIDFSRIRELTKNDSTVTLDEKVLKLMEELGENAKAGVDLISGVTDEKAQNYAEELCDIINVAVDIINCLNDTKNVGFDLEYAAKTTTMTLNGDILVMMLPVFAGKIAQNYLSSKGSANASKSGSKEYNTVANDAFSVIYVCNLILKEMAEENDISTTEESIATLFTSKLDKWESKQTREETKQDV